ncbi:hypothetical protein Asppvi_007421 [Aspergillus pseudoviridinutans]|uniref:NAD-dependent epimerase/dehydratase domain-containing protein n=1 Tax=Aspergillus pseudoviridinutans TaxID=1517512 RepID=A0A9P3BC33_9EURO|nr:uncharacterized protein Asppvi_007421 [Aspergillus pseudoviridinutans]GIJ88497.1 hypothetical protein Asppvi_007421 [Aspergillus pseudoviridinutans]
MTEYRLLLAGATGYIGGSILTGLLQSKNDALCKVKISALVRGEDKAVVLNQLGVQPIVVSDYGDFETIRKAAREHDVVINAGFGLHPGVGKALVEGLGERKKETGKDAYIIHTSGVSNIADLPLSGRFIETRVFSDKDDIYTYEEGRESQIPYPQRTTELTIINTADMLNVKAYIIFNPIIYGIGLGHFNKFSFQIPFLIRKSLAHKQAIMVGKGDGIWGHVHIEDLVDLYLLILEKIVLSKAEGIPVNRKGIYCSEAGENTFLDISREIGKAGKALGVFKADEVMSMSLPEATKAIGFDEAVVELAFASNARTKSDRARELFDWKPKKTFEDFKKSIHDEFKALYQGR